MDRCPERKPVAILPAVSAVLPPDLRGDMATLAQGAQPGEALHFSNEDLYEKQRRGDTGLFGGGRVPKEPPARRGVRRRRRVNAVLGVVRGGGTNAAHR